MSAALLNSAAAPGVGAASGAAGGIAQAAHAAQAHGPLAGFEALLAAFFGDQQQATPTAAKGPGIVGQGIVGQGPAGQTTAGQAITGQTIAGLATAGQTPAAQAGAAAGKSAAKSAKDGDKDPAAADDSDNTAAASTALDAIASSVDAAQTLVVPATPATTPQANTNDAAAGGSETSDSDPSGKAHGAGAVAALTSVIDAKTAKNPDAPSLAALTAALDAKTAKVAAFQAQAQPQGKGAGGQAAGPTTPPAPQPDSGAPPQASLPSDQAAQPDQTEAAGPDSLPAPALAAAAVTAQAKPAEPAGKDKVQAEKGVRVEGAKSEAPQLATGKSAIAIPAFAEGAGKDASSDGRDPNASAPAGDAKPAAATQAANDFNPAGGATAAINNPAALAHAAALARGGAQTIANLAAQIAKKLDGRSTRFDVQLDPAGLGKVDVHVEIDAAGKMTAALAFDNQQAANELKSRAGELQRALEQAGFDMSGGLSFDVASQDSRGGHAWGQDADTTPSFRGRAFQAVLNDADEASVISPPFGRASRSGVDIRI